jgi:hypothetical protein
MHYGKNVAGYAKSRAKQGTALKIKGKKATITTNNEEAGCIPCWWKR